MRPKLWDGPNAVGEARERFNRVIDTPYQTASGPGFTARKMGSFEEVTGEAPEEIEVPLPRFYIMGRIGGVNKLSGSQTAKGSFRKLGEINEADFSLPNVNYLGGGYGVVPASEGGDTYSYRLTKDGKRFRAAVAFQSYYNPAANSVAALVLGAQSKRNARTLVWGVTLNYYDTRWYSTYAAYNGETKAWTAHPLLRVSTSDCGVKLSRIGPTTLIGLTAVHRMVPEVTADVGGHTVLVDPNPGAAPWPFLQKSTDNGATWTAIDIDDAFADFAGNYRAPVVNSAFTGMGYEAMFFPVDPAKTVMVTEFHKHVAYDDHNFEVESVWEYRAYQLVGSTLTKVAALDRAIVEPTKGFMANEMDTTNRKCVMLDWVAYGYDPAYPRHVLCFSFDGGATWTYRQKPWAPHASGFASWLDEDTLVCPVYDGEYALYESKDYGVSWARRATVRTDGDVPVEGMPYLQNFSILRQFRKKDGSPAPVTVGAPWVTDPSVAYEPPA